ncbi:hypothetical protein [Bradyrhizobium roseum]|uniref:hypothetical protein n=1 Tax=Bradyrhizobium roseum TaxID=3056648 RepID=UPI002601C06F|nr:hypothetical protein [Bradyrhizobium roseus]WKA30057.1 hypothetical protein QUH67_07760 [Bradyrhizobium roseus]
MTPVLRPSVPGPPARLAQLFEAAGKVAAREILHGVLPIFSRQGEACTGVTEVGAGTVSEPAHTFGDFLHAAGDVAAPEILRCVLEIFLRQALVYALASVAIVVAVTMVVMVVVMMIEQIVEETSDEASRKKTWEHEPFSIVARDARARLMPTLRCLLTV